MKQKEKRDIHKSGDRLNGAIRRIKEHKGLTQNSKVKASEMKTIESAQILTEEEILSMVNYAETPFEKALIFVLYESGARISELAELKIRKIRFEENGIEYAMISLFGKTGQREVPICSSIPALKEWLQIHPTKKMDDYVFACNIGFYNYVKKILRNAAKKANIQKPIHPHAFRHARATQLAKEGWSETKLCMFFGWTLGSTMPRTYIALSGRDLIGDVLKLNGETPSDEKVESILKPKTCIKCGFKQNSVTDMFCNKCGFPISPEAIEQFENKRKEDMQKQMKSMITEMLPQVLAQTGSIHAPQIQQQFREGYLDAGSVFRIRNGWVVKTGTKARE